MAKHKHKHESPKEDNKPEAKEQEANPVGVSLQISEVAEFKTSFDNRRYDRDKFTRFYNGGSKGKYEVTIAFNVGINGKSYKSGQKANLGGTDFIFLCSLGVIKDVLWDDQIAMIDAAIAEKQGKRETTATEANDNAHNATGV